MFGAIHVENAWVTARVQDLLTKSEIPVSEVLSPPASGFPSIKEGSTEKNGNRLKPVRISPSDELWVISTPEDEEPLIILPSEFVEDPELTGLFV